ncbi:alkyl sulfatase-like hydrolase [gamma proteobacterium HIMB55]|nr:alkyl sulfatase-like hydrolase [gamma proteobacterium HIMB55]
MKQYLIATFIGVLANTALAQPVTAPTDQRVNPAVLAHQATLIPGLQKLGTRVYGAEFMGYSNFGFIETDNGVIVVDAGWFPTPTANAYALLREQTDKPVIAVIYTHLHMDHYGGIQAILPNENVGDIPIYGPADWEATIAMGQSVTHKATLRRAFMQMGIPIPEGLEGTVGNGIGPSPRLERNDALSFPPTIEVPEKIAINIDGVDLEIFPAEGDVPEHLWVWLPEDRVLFSGDAPPHGVFPAVETARFEMGRDPNKMMASVQKTIDLDPLAIVPGHSSIISDHSEIRQLMTLTRDTIQFLIDQVDRFYLTNRSVDDLLNTIDLPPAVAEHPQLQPYYHRWEWMMQQRFTKRAGFIDDWMDYLSHNAYDEAARLVPALGGRDKVMEMAEANVSSDPQWAARLATYLILTNENDEEARQVRQQASIRFAQVTSSTNQRNYLLGLVAEENGDIDFGRMLRAPIAGSLRSLDDGELLGRLRNRVIAENADNVDITVRLDLTDGEVYDLRMINNVLRISWPDEERAVASNWRTDRATVISVLTDELSLNDAITSGRIAASGNARKTQAFASLFE